MYGEHVRCVPHIRDAHSEGEWVATKMEKAIFGVCMCAQINKWMGNTGDYGRTNRTMAGLHKIGS